MKYESFLLHQDCRFEAMYKNHQCWCRLHTCTNQIKIQFLIDQTFGSEITHEFHIQQWTLFDALAADRF